MNKKIVIIGVSILLINIVTMIIVGIIMINIISAPKGIRPMDGAVPNAETAIKIAEAVWYPIYGDVIYSSQPFIAEYDRVEGCWIVQGSLPENTVGGVPIAKINKTNGKILFIYHYK